MQRSFSLLVVFMAVVGGVMLSGCGSSGPDAQVETERVDNAKQMRSIFDNAGGDYEKLSAEDKAKFVKIFGGDEAKAKHSWDAMKNGPSLPAGAAAGQ